MPTKRAVGRFRLFEWKGCQGRDRKPHAERSPARASTERVRIAAKRTLDALGTTPRFPSGAGRSKRSAAPPCSRGSNATVWPPAGRGGKAKPRQGQRPLVGGSALPPLGASICGKGSRREAVGEPRRGAPAFRPLSDVKEFIKLKTARARYGLWKTAESLMQQGFAKTPGG